MSRLPPSVGLLMPSKKGWPLLLKDGILLHKMMSVIKDVPQALKIDILKSNKWPSKDNIVPFKYIFTSNLPTIKIYTQDTIIVGQRWSYAEKSPFYDLNLGKEVKLESVLDANKVEIIYATFDINEKSAYSIVIPHFFDAWSLPEIDTKTYNGTYNITFTICLKCSNLNYPNFAKSNVYKNKDFPNIFLSYNTK